MDISTEQLITASIQIKAKDIFNTKNIDGLISHKLKMYEGKCTKNGFILKGSVELIERSVGKNINIDGNSLIDYSVNYKIKSILPTINSEYKCTVESKTKMGLICYIEFEDLNNISESPLLIIVPKDYYDIKTINEGDKIKVKVIDFRIKYMSEQIRIIGKIED